MALCKTLTDWNEFMLSENCYNEIDTRKFDFTDIYICIKDCLVSLGVPAPTTIVMKIMLEVIAMQCILDVFELFDLDKNSMFISSIEEEIHYNGIMHVGRLEYLIQRLITTHRPVLNLVIEKFNDISKNFDRHVLISGYDINDDRFSVFVNTYNQFTEGE